MTRARLVGLLWLAGCSRSASPTVVEVLPSPDPAPAGPAPVSLPHDSSRTYAEMRGVDFRLDPVLTLHIRHLRGEMSPTEGHSLVSFDDPASFTLAIADADVVVDTLSLARLMNEYVFHYAGAPLTDFDFGVIGDTLLRVRGTLHKAMAIPFTIGARAEATPDGLIRITPVDIKLGAIKVKWLMKALGLTLGELVSTRKAAGVRISGNDLLMSPERMLPPPDIQGHLEHLAIVPDGLALRFKDERRIGALPHVPSDTTARNYMFFRHGTLKFGKLYMAHADMRVVDESPDDPFDFFLQQYERQLVAGRSHVLADEGLLVEMPDYGTLVRQALRHEVGPEPTGHGPRAPAADRSHPVGRPPATTLH